ITDQVPFSV
nr:Chain C, epitope of Melanocyte protein Pmel 17 [synthetic construct]1TVB_F Chain F, epitope of Melanocyte protein Pmel 17 [synthetic construct]6VM7_C Chain C, Melanocyte protein PMEL [Homo sapiens]6VMA_C Chain C, Melanocyte protein PMEL [Homo sapiens]